MTAPIVHRPPSARCEVLVLREGLLSAVAHDLLLRATAFEITVSLEPLAVNVRIDAGSLRVVTALRDGRPLPGALRPSDVQEIEGTVSRTVLRAGDFPEIRFSSTTVRRTEGGFEVRGTLELAGARREQTLLVRREEGRLATEVTLHQPHFGIRPYRAMLGALRVKPDVVVRASVPEDERTWPPAPP